jgi:lipopolysaccharide export system permease protein
MTLARYLSKLFLTRFLMVLLALSALVELLEMLDALRSLLGHHSNLHNILTFSVLRLPMALEQLFLLAVLIGATLTFRTLAQSNEMTVLRGSGMSPYRLMLALVPVTAIMAICYFFIVDRVSPIAERAFAEWWNTVAAQQEKDEDTIKETIWLRSGVEIISVAATEDGSRTIRGVARYQRDDAGRLNGRIRAALARYDGGVWHMYDVYVMRMNGARPTVEHVAALNWTGGPSAGNIEELALPTRRMQSSESRQVLAGEVAGTAGAAHYRLLILKSYSAPLLPFLMLLLATPALKGSGRRTSGRGMTLSIVNGLMFLIVNGFFASMSEAEALSPLVAAWCAPMAFFSFGGFLLLRNEE